MGLEFLIVLSLLTGAASAANQYQSAKYQQKVAENNQAIALQEEKDALERGAQAEQAQRRKNAIAMGNQKSALAAAGIDTSVGGAVDLLSDTAFVGELDAQIIRQNTKREAYASKVSASNYGAEASAYGVAAKNAPAIGVLNTGASVLSLATRYDRGKPADKGVRF